MEICELIDMIKQDKDNFGLLVDKFAPLINKYVKLLYKNESEDTYAELVGALWEAVCNILFYQDEGQVIKYLNTAIKNKYLELYRASRKYFDNTVNADESYMNGQSSVDNAYEDLVTLNDLAKVERKLEGKKKQIFELVFYKYYTDIEVANELNISRQYVHRIKRSLCEMIKKEVLNFQ